MEKLQNELQVIIQHPLPSGRWRCIGVGGLPIVQPCMIVLAPLAESSAEEGICQALADDLMKHLLSLNAHRIIPPCLEDIPDPSGCHALAVASCRKLMVIVGDGTSPGSVQHPGIDWLKLDGRVLPLLKAGATPSGMLPPPLDALQSPSWNTSPAECIPAILSAAGLVPEESRIFISYRRQDTQALADQLFDGLSHQNFDVFLDRFRVPPGVDFQARLSQELEDKSVVLVLESATIHQSPWVEFEINFAKARRLGLLALHLPNGASLSEIDPAERVKLLSGDLDSSATVPLLTDSALSRVIKRIKETHDRMLVWRRRQLRNSIRAALLYVGVPAPTLSARGLLKVASQGQTCAIWPALRALALPDFHQADTDRDPNDRALIVGPAKFLTGVRQAQADWLSRVSRISYFDEGQILSVAHKIATGSV